MRTDKFRIAVRRFPPFESAIAQQWEAFERVAQTGLELDAVPMDLHPLFDATIARGSASEFDVAFVNTDWVTSAHRGDALVDLSGFIHRDPPEGYPDAWAPSMLRLQNVDGHVLGLPYHDGPECLIYRKDLFEAAGERVPETWDEYRRLAKKFHQPEVQRYGTIYAAFPDGHNTVYDFCLQLWTRGGELTDAQGNFRFNSPQAIDALTFLREIINDASAVHPDCRQMDSVQSGLAFAAGEAAMMVNWFGFAAMAETIADSKVKGKLGIAPVPHAPGCKGTSLNIYWILSILSGSTHPEIAWRFLRHCASAEMDRLLTFEGGIGCRKSTWMDEEVNRSIPFYRGMEELHANAREMPRSEDWPEVARIIDRMVLAAIDTSEPAQSIVIRAQSEVNQLIKSSAR